MLGANNQLIFHNSLALTPFKVTEHRAELWQFCLDQPVHCLQWSWVCYWTSKSCFLYLKENTTVWTCCSSFPCPSFSKEAWDCSGYKAGVEAGGLRLQSRWSGLKATWAHLMCLQSNNRAAFEVWGVQRIEQAHGTASKNRLHPGSVILQCTAQVPAQVTNINPTLIFQYFRQWKSWAGLLLPPAVQAWPHSAAAVQVWSPPCPPGSCQMLQEEMNLAARAVRQCPPCGGSSAVTIRALAFPVGCSRSVGSYSCPGGRLLRQVAASWITDWIISGQELLCLLITGRVAGLPVHISPPQVHFSPNDEGIDLEFHMVFYVTSCNAKSFIPASFASPFQDTSTHTNIAQW